MYCVNNMLNLMSVDDTLLRSTVHVLCILCPTVPILVQISMPILNMVRLHMK
jgi:hypothetical protein